MSFNEGLVWTRAHEDVRGPAEEGLSQLGGDYFSGHLGGIIQALSAGRVRPRRAVTPNERWRPDKLKHVGHWNNFLESRSQEGWQSGTYAQLQYSSLATPPLDLLLDHIAGCQV